MCIGGAIYNSMARLCVSEWNIIISHTPSLSQLNLGLFSNPPVSLSTHNSIMLHNQIFKRHYIII